MRELLVWQINDLLRQYVWARDWWEHHDPAWIAWREARER